MYKKDAARKGLRYPDALDEALCFGWIDGQVKAVDENRYRQRWTPRRAGSVWSLVNKNKAKRLIAEGRMAAAGLAAIKEARRNGKWQAAYTSRDVVPVPQDLGRALRAVPAAWQHFSAFPVSARSMYAAWVVQARQTETRLRRIDAVVRRARENRRPGMESMYK
jgi:uncharacterized protein YdeI (YjbR/CyaY-like superfamily)